MHREVCRVEHPCLDEMERGIVTTIEVTGALGMKIGSCDIEHHWYDLFFCAKPTILLPFNDLFQQFLTIISC